MMKLAKWSVGILFALLGCIIGFLVVWLIGWVDSLFTVRTNFGRFVFESLLSGIIIPVVAVIFAFIGLGKVKSKK